MFRNGILNIYKTLIRSEIMERTGEHSLCLGLNTYTRIKPTSAWRSWKIKYWPRI